MIWNRTSGEELRRITVNNTRLVAISGDGALLAAAAFEPTGDADGDFGIRIWDVATGANIARFLTGTAPVTATAFMPSGQQLVTGMADGTVLVWHLSQPGD